MNISAADQLVNRLLRGIDQLTPRIFSFKFGTEFGRSRKST